MGASRLRVKEQTNIKGTLLILSYIYGESITTYFSDGSGPGSSVSIATGYGLDVPRIESRWGLDFPHLSGRSLGPTQPPVQ